jgi:hypothetical protein
MAKKNKNQPVEVVVEIDGHRITAAPNERSESVERLLKRRDADSFVFIPLARLGKKGKQLLRKPKVLVRRKAKLPKLEWYDGELQSLEDDNAVPGVLAFDVRRRTAREIAEKAGVNQFIWGTSGAPVETHDVKLFEDDGENTWSAARAKAFAGLPDMVRAARNMERLPAAVEASQTTMDKFWRLVGIVLGAAVVGGAVKAAVAALLSSDEGSSWLVTMMNIVFYPFVIPAVLVGIYLRVLMRRGEQEARDFTTSEAEENWTIVAPHLLALWALCWLAIVLLTWLQSVPTAELGFLGRTDGVVTSLIICVWMLLPIAHSHDVETLFSSAFEAAITAAVSIFTIKLTLYLTNLVTDTLIGIVTSIVPIEIPERLLEIASAIINFGAEVFFVAVLLGYAWSRTRQQFMRL